MSTLLNPQAPGATRFPARRRGRLCPPGTASKLLASSTDPWKEKSKTKDPPDKLAGTWPPPSEPG